MEELLKSSVTKRIWAFVLAVLMLVSMIPETAYAAAMPMAEFEQEITDAEADTADVIDGEEVTVDSVSDGEVEPFISADIKVAIADYSYEVPAGLKYDNITNTVSTQWVEGKENIFGNFPTMLKDTNKYSIQIKVSPSEYDTFETRNELKKSLIFKWQIKDAEGKFADMSVGDVPTIVGSYKLLIGLDASLAKAETREVNFEITKPQIALTYDASVFSPNFLPGVAVKEVKENLWEALNYADYASYLEEPVIVVKDSFKEEEVSDDSVLKLRTDYSVYVTTVVKAEYADIYELIQLPVVNLNVNTQRQTQILITGENAEINREYTSEPVGAPVVNAENAEVTVEVLGEVNEGELSAMEVAYEDLEKIWVDAEGKVLEQAPVDVGVYQYVLKYKDPEGIYADASASIKVIITPIALVLKPELLRKEYFVEMTPWNITRAVTFTLEGKVLDFEEDYTSETFWGVSYDNADMPQAYLPVFKVQKGITTTVGGVTETTWETLQSKDVIKEPSGENEDGEIISYRVIFGGTKGLLYYGTIHNEEEIPANADINSATRNYIVDVEPDTLAEYAIPITVNESTNAVIDVSKMLPDDAGKNPDVDADTIFTKIYDGKSFYDDRAGYKKAALETEEGKRIPVSGTDDAFTYEWGTFSMQDKPDEMGNPVLDENGETVQVPVWEPYDVYTSYYELPCDSGDWALAVYYNDPAHEYVAEPAYIFFHIDKQLVKLIPEGEIEVYSGKDADSVVKNLYADKYELDWKVYAIPENDLETPNDKLVELEKFSKEANEKFFAENEDYLYDLEWFVEKGDSADPETAVFTEMSLDEKFEYSETAQTPYRMGAKIHFTADKDTLNYPDNYEVIAEDGESSIVWTCGRLPITVNKMGETPITIHVNADELPETEKVYDGRGFDLSEAIADGLISVTVKDMDEEVPVTGADALNLTYTWVKEGYEKYSYSPSDAGIYTLFVKFEGDDTYQNTHMDWEYGEKVGTFTINRRDLVITPSLADVIPAGLHMSLAKDRELLVNHFIQPEITGFIDQDAYAFGNGYLADANAIASYLITVKDENSNLYANVLRTGKEYTTAYRVEYYDVDEDFLYDKNAENYNIVLPAVKFSPNKRGHSIVSAKEYSPIGLTYLSASYDDLNVTVTPASGIPYAKGPLTVTSGENRELDGNYFLFCIERPAELSVGGYDLQKQALYKNSIEKSGGIVVYESYYFIYVAFDAAGGSIREFDIRWEADYTEHFKVDLTGAELQEDYEAAVAPKSLAFNGVVTKMSVGDTQQLDVKVSKVLIDDIICLDYAVVEGENVISVTHDGLVTALQPGKAKVEVFPVGKDAKGNATRLNYNKKVVASITVSNVKAPKISKVAAYDDWAAIEYVKPTDGYRREVYIMQGKGFKPQDFEDKIALMENGFFGGSFLEDDVIDDGFYALIADEEYDVKTITYKTGKMLKPNTDYTVYVRNVSGIRTIADGSFVVASATGSVKSFKTTKSQVEELDWYFTNQPVKFDRYKKEYMVRLAESTVKLTPAGWFWYREEKAAAERYELERFELPLSKEQQNIYMNPKLSMYAVRVLGTPYTDTKQGEYTLKVGDRYYAPSKIAKVDKNGKISLLGVGKVYIIMYDSLTGLYSEPCLLNITSDVSKITAKKTTLKAGTAINVYDTLTFYDENGKALKTDYAYELNEPVIISGDGVSVESRNHNEWFAYANKANKTAQLKVSVKSDKMIQTTLEISTKPMDPVKKLKAINVMDKSAEITFMHLSNAAIGNLVFRIDVKNGRGGLVQSVVKEAEDIRVGAWDPKAGWSYRYKIEDLAYLSTYKVFVTPLYYDNDRQLEAAKPANATIKTTDVPAYHGELLAKDELGGMQVYYNTPSTALRVQINDFLFTAGKKYTFRAYADYPLDGRNADTLTWKSSNTKVGTIKPNPGTMDATFTALKQGVTTIEVSSKLRKGVIARYIVRVKALGGAGGHEVEDYQIMEIDKYYMAPMEVLTQDNPADVKAADNYEYRWVKFVVPAYGKYTFARTGGTLEKCYLQPFGTKEADAEELSLNLPANSEFAEGDTLYFKISGSFRMSVTGTEYQKMILNAPFHVKDTKMVMFTAPESNYYSFKSSERARYASFKVNGVTYGDCDFNYTSYALNRGDVVLMEIKNSGSYDISVSNRQVTVLETSAETGDLRDGNDKWYSFKAPVAGIYTIQSENATDVVSARLFDTVMDEDAKADSDTYFTQAADGKNFTGSIALNKGESILFRVYTESTATTAVAAKVTVSAPIVDSVEPEKEQEITVGKDGETWVSFTVEETPARYQVQITCADGTNFEVNASFFKNSVRDNLHLTPVAGLTGQGIYSYSYGDVKKNDVIYIRLKTDSEADSEKLKMLVKKVLPTEIKEGETEELTVNDYGVYYYTFTAPRYGWYSFESAVTENAADVGTHTLKAGIMTNIAAEPTDNWDVKAQKENNFRNEMELKAGQKFIFAVRSDDRLTADVTQPVTTNADISVKEIKVENLPEGEITLKAGETKWYQFKTPVDDTYVRSVECSANIKVYANTARKGIRSYAVNGIGEKVLALGDIYYFMLENNGAADEKVKITVKGTESVTEGIPSDVFEVEPETESIYKFTVKKPGRYKVAFESLTEGVTPTVAYGETYTGSQTTVKSGTEYLWKNIAKTYYFRVTTDNKDAAKRAEVSLKVTEVLPESFDGEETVSLQPNEKLWFRYTVPATGRYDFLAMEGTTDISGNVEIYAGTGWLDMWQTSWFANYSGNVWLEKGKVFYFPVKNTTATEKTIALSIKAIEPDDITFGTPFEVSLEKDEVAWVKFASDISTYYTLLTDAADKKAFNISIYKNTEGNSARNWEHDESLPFEKNEFVWLRIERSNSVADEDVLTANITIRQEEMLTLKSGEDLPITIENGGKKFISFTPTKTGNFAFGVKEVPENVTLKGDLFDASTYYVAKPCTLGKSEIFELGTTFGGTEETVTYKVYAEEITAKSILENVKKTEDVDRYRRVWYSFTAPRDGYYRVTPECDAAEMKSEFHLKSMDAPLSARTEDTLLKKGDVIYACVWWETSETAGLQKAALSVTATEVLPTLFDAAGNAVADLEPGQTEWFEFRVPESGRYNFEVMDGTTNITNRIYVHLEDKNKGGWPYVTKKDWPALDGYTEKMWLNEGDIYYLPITNATGEAKKINLSASPLASSEISFNTPMTFEMEKKEKQWFKFTSETDNVYTANWTPQSGFSVHYYKNDGGSEFWDVGGNVSFAKGDVVWISFERTEWDSNEELVRTAEFTLSMRDTNPESIVFTGDEATVTAGAQGDWYTYTVPETGVYQFSYTLGAGEIYQSLSDTTGMNGSILLAAGDKIYLKLVGNEENAYQVTVKASVDKAVALELDTSVEVSVTQEEVASGLRVRYVSFTAPEDGTYNLVAVWKTGTVATHYSYYAPNENGKLVEEFLGYGTNIDKKINLTKNTTVFLAVKNDYERTTTTNIVITKVTE